MKGLLFVEVAEHNFLAVVVVVTVELHDMLVQLIKLKSTCIVITCSYSKRYVRMVKLREVDQRIWTFPHPLARILDVQRLLT